MDEILHDLLPGTDQRVPLHTRPSDNQRIQARTLHDVSMYFGASDQTLTARIHELEREWDIERTLEANAAAIALIGLTLSLTVDRRFLVLPVAVSAFLLQHALQGWCPPLPLLRRLGIRTSAEIHQEIIALRILRGDFIDQPVYPESLLAKAAL
ncbi:MAG TPA: hypothetical protein VFP37_18905 [Steroidobacteraceae bacterium]|nr:hypothetical protein [Steroidobacteraceae bacterium]